MPKFSDSSGFHLRTCDGQLQTLFKAVVETYDCTVIEGVRPREIQNEYFRTGRSRVEWPNSKHNCVDEAFCSRAADVAPCPIDWNDTKRFYHFAGFVLGVATELDILLRWGGDWDSDYDLNDQRFMDLVHFELLED